VCDLYTLGTKYPYVHAKRRLEQTNRHIKHVCPLVRGPSLTHIQRSTQSTCFVLLFHLLADPGDWAPYSPPRPDGQEFL